MNKAPSSISTALTLKNIYPACMDRVVKQTRTTIAMLVVVTRYDLASWPFRTNARQVFPSGLHELESLKIKAKHGIDGICLLNPYTSAQLSSVASSFQDEIEVSGLTQYAYSGASDLKPPCG